MTMADAVVAVASPVGTATAAAAPPQPPSPAHSPSSSSKSDLKLDRISSPHDAHQATLPAHRHSLIDSSLRSTSKEIIPATGPANAVPAPAAAADNSESHAPSPISADSPQPSHSDLLSVSIPTARDNDSVATIKTTPSPTTGKRPDIPARKPLPSASPEVEDSSSVQAQ